MKKFTFILLLIGISNLLIGQYNYGLEICDQDAKIEGKLNLNVGTNSVIIGLDAGISIDPSTIGENTFVGFNSGMLNTIGTRNNLFGYNAGQNLISGSENVLVGHRSGLMLSTGWNNTFVGNLSGYRVSSGFNNVLLGNNAGGGVQSGWGNTIIGTSAGTSTQIGANNVLIGFTSGQNNNGSNNVFIGYQSGQNETGSNKLVIENTNSNTPLIFGEFDNDKIQVNGSFHVRDAFQLIPQAPPSGSCTEMGEMIYGTDDELYLCKGGIWKQVMTN